MFVRRYSQGLILIMCLIGFCNHLSAQAYSTIKVGLESVYHNVSAMTLRSDGALTIGYYTVEGFKTIGTLETNEISIQKATGQYYDIAGIYQDYDTAYQEAKKKGGIPVYVDEGLFAVYGLDDKQGTAVPITTNRYIVKDSSGRDIFIFNKGTRCIEFRGYDTQSGMYLTQVGSHKKYRGAIGIGGITGITPYNVLDMEQYLYGVIPGEMSPSWPIEALKAQAVAARSIAIYQYDRYVARGYNVVDTTATQVYGGYLKEDSRTNRAVDETRGETIRYQGKIAEALYFSTSGGFTEAAKNVWGNNIPYLVSVPDRYETEPAQHPWSRQITLTELDRCLQSKGIQIGTARGVEIVERTSSGRVNEMTIIGTVGSYTLKREAIRTFFSPTSDGSLKSRLFSFKGNMGDESEQSTQLTLLSASGKKEIAVDSLCISNGKQLQEVGSQLAIQSASGTQVVTVPSSHPSTDKEKIWGDFIIYGEGFGHGVGMSQSGAKGMAKAGFSYTDILKHYYTGVTVEK